MVQILPKALATPRDGAWQEWLGPGLMALLILLTALLGDLGRELLRYDRAAIDVGQWWRLLTGNLVHVGWYHLLLNEIGLFILVLLCAERLPLRWWGARLLWLSLCVGLGIHWFSPETSWYVGLSGAQHGFFVIGLWPLARRGELIPIGCLLYLVGKLLWEEFGGGVISDTTAIGAEVLTWSHFSGAIGGGLWLLFFSNFETKKQAKTDNKGD